MLQKDFYARFDTRSLARELLGCVLVHETPEGTTSGIIVETEAYLCDDPACHAFNRRTTRTEVMYGEPGLAYVYQIYGMYFCFNVVSAPAGTGEAVLIRALEPLEGIALMRERRSAGANTARTFKTKELCNGPGKLVQAMGIHKSQTFHDLVKPPLYINEKVSGEVEVVVSKRIGIAEGKGHELLYRYFIKGNVNVSRP